jgi:hypothetical protein
VAQVFNTFPIVAVILRVFGLEHLACGGTTVDQQHISASRQMLRKLSMTPVIRESRPLC